MLPGYPKVAQALLGTLFTWGVTALGAALVFVLPNGLSKRREREILDVALGFASGVMLAASFWSLLEPALEAAQGYLAPWLPVSVGVLSGGAFVLLSDAFFPDDVQRWVESSRSSQKVTKKKRSRSRPPPRRTRSSETKKLLILVMAITIHNFPEGLAVGVGFGSQEFSKARNLAVGVGIQNFPEGLAVSLPLRRLGFSKTTCFMIGQLSGAVEPIGGVLGAYAVFLVKPLLPYALSFAAGAMICVVLDTHASHKKLYASSALLGFVLMMSLDVGLG